MAKPKTAAAPLKSGTVLLEDVVLVEVRAGGKVYAQPVHVKAMAEVGAGRAIADPSGFAAALMRLNLARSKLNKTISAKRRELVKS